jgi:NAD(P)-dependent dehydrogenase (short-subunit alcohol dehydrogenase family)
VTSTWFITGVSAGLGRSLALEALRRGDTVVGTVRRAEQAEAFTRTEPGRSSALLLDVTSGPDAVRAAVGQAVDSTGGLDIVVNNAGYGLVGAVEEVSDAEARRIVDTNFFGALHVCQAAVPHLRERGGGSIVNISSTAGVVGWAGNGLYSASKFALEGMSEALRREVTQFGITVTLVQPGSFRTDWAGRSLVMAERRLPEYDSVVATRAFPTEVSGTEQGDPDAAARAIADAVASGRPPLRLPLGPDAVAVVERRLAQVGKELAAWRDVALATSYPG